MSRKLGPVAFFALVREVRRGSDIIELTATGRDAETAVGTLAHLIECKFDED